MKKTIRPSKIEKVYLEDHWGSASQAILSVRAVLWGIVEHVAQQQSQEEEHLPSHNHYEDNPVEDDAALPIQFGSKKSQKRKNKKRKRWTGRLPSVDQLPVLAHDESQVIEHNIAYMENTEFSHHAVLKSSRGGKENIVSEGVDESRVWLRVMGIAAQNGHVLVKKLPSREFYVVDYSKLHFVHLTKESAMGYSRSETDVWESFYLDKPWYKGDIEVVEVVHDKYWDQRYRIFSRYDEGIRLDAESWYSITYEIAGEYIAEKCLALANQSQSMPTNVCSLDVVLDCFSGCGGSAIPFARRGVHTIAVDIDPIKLSHLKHNSRIYEAADNVDCLQADVWSTLFQLGNSARFSRLCEKLVKTPALPQYHGYQVTASAAVSPPEIEETDQNVKRLMPKASGKADLVILSPPWGGPEYLNTPHFDLTSMLTFMNGYIEEKVQEVGSGDEDIQDGASVISSSVASKHSTRIEDVRDGITLVLAASAVADNIVYIVPRNTITTQLTVLASLLAVPYQIEEIMINNKAKVTVAYFGYIFKKHKLSSL